ncbi:hypothetical protein [Serratia marcescens]|uniref:hypothetical protein n=1 Tax=Serratia marcescens TaxID=615 RepID=UPI000E569B9D|nr:hypothetical protein [Serratia marcescens]AXX22132.1 hypothetical protein C7M66_24360 [Serratia marcescens]AXX25035.1 hypothetical protein C7M65_13650 [Serratia marcescens]RTE99069.1 hypothetical protein C7M70_11460 [Serratia marcescens]RTF00480.1 hypothetical protein C7M68_16435 [Serratia marcescens]RTF08349.1 hypothetical protein C7M69_07680 [Serratia marcescens]
MKVIGTEYKKRLKLLSLQAAASLKYAEAFEAVCDYSKSEEVAEKDLLSLLSFHAEKMGYVLVEKVVSDEEATLVGLDGKHGYVSRHPIPNADPTTEHCPCHDAQLGDVAKRVLERFQTK